MTCLIAVMVNAGMICIQASGNVIYPPGIDLNKAAIEFYQVLSKQQTVDGLRDIVCPKGVVSND